MAGDVRRLKVFQLAYALSLDLHRASHAWPRTEQYGGVADQVRRASKSVCALLVEGGGRQARSEAEFQRYVVMALASADEVVLWCDYARDLGFSPADLVQSWQSQAHEVARMLHGLLRAKPANPTN